MHTIRKTKVWSVIFETDKEYSLVCWTHYALDAAAIASWLNGGADPGLGGDRGGKPIITWAGEQKPEIKGGEGG